MNYWRDWLYGPRTDEEMADHLEAQIAIHTHRKYWNENTVDGSIIEPNRELEQ